MNAMCGIEGWNGLSALSFLLGFVSWGLAPGWDGMGRWPKTIFSRFRFVHLTPSTRDRGRANSSRSPTGTDYPLREKNPSHPRPRLGRSLNRDTRIKKNPVYPVHPCYFFPSRYPQACSVYSFLVVVCGISPANTCCARSSAPEGSFSGLWLIQAAMSFHAVGACKSRNSMW